MKTLVIYFSASGVTAHVLANAVQADLYEIKPDFSVENHKGHCTVHVIYFMVELMK